MVLLDFTLVVNYAEFVYDYFFRWITYGTGTVSKQYNRKPFRKNWEGIGITFIVHKTFEKEAAYGRTWDFKKTVLDQIPYCVRTSCNYLVRKTPTLSYNSFSRQKKLTDISLSIKVSFQSTNTSRRSSTIIFNHLLQKATK